MLNLFRKRLTNRKGFTLVELLVVIAIIGVLAAIAIPKFTDATNSAKIAKIQADLRSIDSTIAIYQAKNGSAPADLAALVTAGLLSAVPKPPEGCKTAVPDKTSVAASVYALTSGRATYEGETADKVK